VSDTDIYNLNEKKKTNQQTKKPPATPHPCIPKISFQVSYRQTLVPENSLVQHD